MTGPQMDENLNVGTQNEHVEITIVQSSLYSGTFRGHKRGFAWTKIKTYGGGWAGVRFDDKGRKRGDTGPLRRGRPLSRD